jgi:microcystin degradation protein MlrC
MRIAIGGLYHETNTFNARRTELESFGAGFGATVSGNPLLTHFQDTRTVLGGFIASALQFDFELVPTFYAQGGLDTGTVSQEAFDYLERKLLDAISSARADGVLMNLHGAMVTEKYDDPEAEVLRKTKEVVSGRTPVVLVHDLHGNISQDWLEHSDAIIGYKTSPHLDEFERGLEGGKLISRILKGHVKPTMAVRKPPILIGGGLMTVVDQPLAMVKPPLYRLVSLARKMEQEKRVVNVTVAGGFGHSDVPRAGLGIVVTTNNDQQLAEEKASELEKLAWSLRDEFVPDRVLVSTEAAMKEALATNGGPVVLADQGDNAAGGGPSDATYILSELKNADWPDATLIIRDPEAVGEACRAGVGREVNLTVGAKTDDLHGRPVGVKGRVKLLSDGTYADPRQKTIARMGTTAVIASGATDLVLTQHMVVQAELAPFLSVGIDPSKKKIVAVKSAQAFRHYYEKFAKLILEVDTPGITSPNVSRFTYRKVRRPIYPLDVDMNAAP